MSSSNRSPPAPSASHRAARPDRCSPKPAAADYAVGWNGVAISKVTGLQTALDAKPDSTTVNIIWTGTQVAYDAIGTKDPATLYVIS